MRSVLLACLVFASAAGAQEPDLVARAESGDVAAQIELGRALRWGRGIERDEVRATDWLEKAAATGNARAQAELGSLLVKRAYTDQELVDASGREMDKFFEQGIAWLEKSAAQGDPRGQTWLGEVLLPRDAERALALFRAAAAAGVPTAQYELGRLLADGRGTARDAKQALHWYRKAAEYDDRAQLALGLALMEGDGVARDRDEARQWLERAAAKDNAHARVALAPPIERIGSCDLGRAPPASWVAARDPVLSFLLPTDVAGEAIEGEGWPSYRYSLPGLRVAQSRGGEEPAGQQAWRGGEPAWLEWSERDDGSGHAAIMWGGAPDYPALAKLDVSWSRAELRDDACAILASARPPPSLGGIVLVRTDVEAKTATLRERDGRERTIGMDGAATRQATGLEAIEADRIEIAELFGNGWGGWIETHTVLKVAR